MSTPSNVAGPTRFAPSSDGYEAPAETGVRGRMAAKAAATLAIVTDHNGFVVHKSETGTTDVTNELVNPTPPPMAQAIIAAAQAVGADPARLVDSEFFLEAVGPISASDSAGLEQAVADAMAANPSLALAPPAAPGMRPNRAQGSSGAGWTPTPTTAADRIRREAAKATQQPIPPGSTV